MDIVLWQKKWAQEVKKTFPRPFTTEGRFLSLFRQVSEASMEMAKSKGIVALSHHVSHNNYKQYLSNIFIDLFVLCEEEEVNLEEEFKTALKWFKEQREKSDGGR